MSNLSGIGPGCYRVAAAREGLDALGRFAAQIIAALDECLADTLESGSPDEVVDSLRDVGFTKTAAWLRQQRSGHLPADTTSGQCAPGETGSESINA